MDPESSWLSLSSQSSIRSTENMKSSVDLQMIFDHGLKSSRSFHESSAVSCQLQSNSISANSDSTLIIESVSDDVPEIKSRKVNRDVRINPPRPANSFIIYRREKHAEISLKNKGLKSLNNNLVSKVVADMWKEETADVKAIYAAKAEHAKQEHLLKYPDYKYQPKKNPKRTKAYRKRWPECASVKQCEYQAPEHFQPSIQPNIQNSIFYTDFNQSIDGVYNAPLSHNLEFIQGISAPFDLNYPWNSSSEQNCDSNDHQIQLHFSHGSASPSKLYNFSFDEFSEGH